MGKFGLVLLCALIAPSVQSQSIYELMLPQSGPRPLIPLVLPNQDELDGNAFFEDADKLEKEGYLHIALTLFGKAAFEYNSAQLKSRYASAMLRMSNIHLQLKNYKAAEDVVLNVVLKTYARMGSKSGEMNAYQQLGKIYLGANKLPQSLWFFSQQGLLALKLSNKLSYIESVLDIARVKIKKRDLSLATKDVNRAESLAKSAKTNKYSKDIQETRKLIAQASGKKA